MSHIVAFSSRQRCVPTNNPLFLLPPFTKLHLKFDPDKHKNQSIHQFHRTKQQLTQEYHHKHYFPPISAFHVSGLNASFQISETSRFARKTENTAQINSVTFDLRIIAFRPIVKYRAIRLLYFMTIID